MRFHWLSLRGLRLSFKLAGSYLLLAGLMAGIGGAGLFFIQDIRASFREITDQATPMVWASVRLQDSILAANVDSMQSLTMENRDDIQKQTALVRRRQAAFAQTMASLAPYLKSSQSDLDAGQIDRAQKIYFSQAFQLLAAQGKKHEASAVDLAAYEKLCKKADRQCQDLINRALSALNEKEDRTRTLIQSGEAGKGKMEQVLSELFAKDQALLQSSFKLQMYLLGMQDLARAYKSETDASRLAALEKRFKKEYKKAGSRLKRLKRVTREGENQASFQALAETLPRLESMALAGNGLFPAHRAYLAAYHEVERLKGALALSAKAVIDQLDKVSSLARAITNRVQSVTSDKVNRARLYIGLVVAVGVFLALFCTWAMTRLITRPLHAVVDGLRDGASLVASSSERISAASQSLAEGASEQAASLEETSASVEQVSSMAKRNFGNSQQADQLMRSTNQVVEQANQAVSDLRSGMESINATSSETFKIIKTIDEIAFRTNLLALNAAVEAARAGEAGAGFAVVADEVRNLAGRAAEAARNTSSLIEQNIRQIKQGAELAGSTDQAFRQVAESSRKVAQLVAEIATASGEQTSGIEQINRTAASIDKVTSAVAVNAQETAAAAAEMAGQATSLNRMVLGLKSMMDGNASGRRETELIEGPEQPRKLPA